jgi:hypothetical protein
MRKILLALLAAFGAAAFAVPIVAADPFIEPAFYNGQLVHFLLPSASSANPNEQVVADWLPRRTAGSRQCRPGSNGVHHADSRREPRDATLDPRSPGGGRSRRSGIRQATTEPPGP